MVYVRKGPFVDVENPKAPPAGAKHIDAEYLNGVEDYLAAQDTANAKFDAKVRVDTTVGKRVYVADAAGVEHMVSGDTGERDITALLTPAVVSGKMILSRTGVIVQLEFYYLILQAEAASYISYPGLLPAGFRPKSPYIYFNTVARSTTEDMSGVRPDSNGGIGIYGVKANEAQYGMFTWRTPDPWPTTLPGTPG